MKPGPGEASLDPITLEIMFNAFRSVTDETFIALMKSAYSTNIKERRDHSTAIMDPSGRLIVQAEASLPIHLASMGGLMGVLLEKFGDDVHEGDIFFANDPHVAGGTHLPDINMAMPVFHEGTLVAFMCNIAHHADIGGAVPGSMAGGMTEIYQEGLRIPVVRLFERGKLQTDLLDLVLLNVRIPTERRGDYFAQIAACRLGEARLGEVIAQYGLGSITAGFDEIVSRTAGRMREAVATLPDGTYRFEDVMDDDGMGTRDIPVVVAITVKGSDIHFDFTGTAKQVLGNINVTRNATQASVCYALKALLDPDAPNNQGMLDLPRITVEKGTLLDAAFPAPVAARANTCQRIIDVIIGALSQAIPEAAVAAANGANTTAVFSGTDPRTGETYVYLETLGGGFGGRATKDGKDGVQVHITNTSNLPIEAIELEYPLMVRSYGFIENSGGPGRHRGGLGLERIVEPVDHECTFNGAGERFANRPWGLFGGGEGSPGEFLKLDGSGKPKRLPNKPIGVRIGASEAVVIRSPGAGGYGNPDERNADALAEDAESAKFSADYLERHYPNRTPS
ncbi:MAG: hydantoinase B/oxoprolinase family protein [Proteobacteria bacterium]|nr:hydantoinase B/oxoprolinase family protein [Pseudomonadota bacterium]